MKSGRSFIVIEGIDGSGKTVQSKKLVRWLNKTGFKSCYTKEPTNGSIGRILKKMAKMANVDVRVEALLFAADRLDHLNRVVLPSLQKGYIVVSDRYVYSSLAYQSVTTNDPEWVAEINKFAYKPDLAILLDVKPSIGLSRIKKYRVRFEEEEFLEKVREKYLEIAVKDGLKIVDASRSIEEVFQEIIQVVENFLRID
ncbi:MAG: dTMP kinase [Aigarchaeota archaeon]|nr:dTMP kinase [Aigarchaeota archaeon]MCX8192372.1 dTMP kinase [Nitrososphaeria archaeon]MDW7986959.1 dTMP kinase [Nitrososphaerota archaeon]